MSEIQIDDDRAEFGIIASQELAGELSQNISAMDLLIPLGEVVPIATGIAGVPTPDPNVWQECNGSEITNPNSPLRSIGGTQRFTPDMVDRYIKVPTIFGESGLTGGENETDDLEHDHEGVTGDFTSAEDVDQSSALQESAFVHNHTISTELSGPINIEPPFVTVKFFMRIQ